MLLHGSKFRIIGVDSVNPQFLAELVLSDNLDLCSIKAGYMPGELRDVDSEMLYLTFTDVLSHMKPETTWEFNEYDENGLPTLGRMLIQSIILGHWGDGMGYEKILVTREN